MATGWRKYSDYDAAAFGRWVKRLRREQGLTQAQLAKVLGLGNKGSFSHVEAGKRGLSPQQRQTLVQTLTEAHEHGEGMPERIISRYDLSDLAGLAREAPDPNVRIDAAINSAAEPAALTIWEDRARTAIRQGQLQQAAHCWSVGARLAERRGDWPVWARCLWEATSVALGLGHYALAWRHCQAILARPEEEVGSLAVARAYIGQGWVAYKWGDYHRAIKLLTRGIQQARSNQQTESEASNSLISTGLHFLGRSYGDWGLREDHSSFMQEGLVYLRRQHAFDVRNKVDPSSEAVYLLRQIPLLAQDASTRDDAWHNMRQLLDAPGASGITYLEQARLLRDDGHINRAHAVLDKAEDDFANPHLYPSGEASVLCERSILTLDNKGSELHVAQKALELALAGALLHPYAQNLDVLQSMAAITFQRMDRQVDRFQQFWDMLIEDTVWQMADPPFRVLNHLRDTFGADEGLQAFEQGVERAQQIVSDEILL